MSVPATHAYVGYSPCGHVVFIGVDSPQVSRDIAREISRLIREGGWMERVTMNKIPGDLNGCEKCRPKGWARKADAEPSQAALFV